MLIYVCMALLKDCVSNLHRTISLEANALGVAYMTCCNIHATDFAYILIDGYCYGPTFRFNDINHLYCFSFSIAFQCLYLGICVDIAEPLLCNLSSA